MHGAKIVEGSPVARVLTEPVGAWGHRRRACGVLLEDGRTIRAKTVINCNGMWARQLNEDAGVVCPNQALRIV